MRIAKYLVGTFIASAVSVAGAQITGINLPPGGSATFFNGTTVINNSGANQTFSVPGGQFPNVITFPSGTGYVINQSGSTTLIGPNATQLFANPTTPTTVIDAARGAAANSDVRRGNDRDNIKDNRRTFNVKGGISLPSGVAEMVDRPAKGQADAESKPATADKNSPPAAKTTVALPACTGPGADGQACGQEKKDVVAERMNSGFVRNLGNAPPTDIQIRDNGATEPIESK